ncbi:hypothetical protein [Polaromonas sp. DSR2-3-2]|uniref:hypothetical protein n=1 Tax=unclassified Polaromonas TaxID=2638319 RepID=UPI003CF8AD62
MELSKQDMQAKIDDLTRAMVGLVAKEVLWRQAWDRERKEILDKIDGINEIVGTKDTYGNGLAAVELTRRFGWELVVPNRMGGHYYGTVVAMERHLALVKFASTKMLELPFGAMAVTQEQSPKLGDSVLMVFKNGVLTATVMPHTIRSSTPEQTNWRNR